MKTIQDRLSDMKRIALRLGTDTRAAVLIEIGTDGVVSINEVHNNLSDLTFMHAFLGKLLNNEIDKVFKGDE